MRTVHLSLRVYCLFLFLLIAGQTGHALGGQVLVQGFTGSFTVPVKSLKEARWDRVIRQQYDFSCGSAAVATLLSHHYGMKIDEAEVFQAMFKAGDQAKIRAEGFSMLDMKRFLDSQGLQSDGFRMTLDQLLKIGVPGIVLVNTDDPPLPEEMVRENREDLEIPSNVRVLGKVEKIRDFFCPDPESLLLLKSLLSAKSLRL